MDVIKSMKNKKCSICGKAYEHKQFIFSSSGIWIPNCKCEEELEEKRKNREKAKQARKDLCRRYKKAGFTAKSRGKRLNHLTCEHLNESKIYVECFQPRMAKGFHFVGPNGNGKTTLSICIGKELILKGYCVQFMTFSDCVRLLQSTYGNKNSLEFKEQMQELAKNDLLILDDFGREAYKDRTLTDVFDFLNFLYNKKANVILTSNPEMIEKIKQIPDFRAMLDRLYEMSHYREFKRKSYRREI
jgi:DNA replication protein DnaC